MRVIATAEDHRPPPQRLLHVFPSFAPGGAQRRTQDLANRLGRGFEHAILALDGTLTASAGLAAHVAWSAPQIAWRRSSTVAPDNLVQLRRLLRELRPDLLLTYNFGALEAAIANRVLPICPHLHFEDGFGPDEADGRQLRRRVWLRRLALGRSSRVVVPSRTLLSIATETWGLPTGRVLLIRNGIDLNRFRQSDPPPVPLPTGGPLLGSVGMFRPEKGFARLLRVFARLPAELGCRLILIGDGPLRGALEAQALALGVRERVTFTGFLDRPETVLTRLDVFALTSDTEQMPYGLIEAMAAGLAVVATDVGDVRELLPEPQRPFVVPAADEDRLLTGLRSLLRDPALRRRLGAANCDHGAASYGIDTMVRRYDALLRSTIAGPQVRAAAAIGRVEEVSP